MEIDLRTAPYYTKPKEFTGFDTLKTAHLHNRYVIPLWKWRIIKLFL